MLGSATKDFVTLGGFFNIKRDWSENNKHKLVKVFLISRERSCDGCF